MGGKGQILFWATLLRGQVAKAAEQTRAQDPSLKTRRSSYKTQHGVSKLQGDFS